VKGINQALDGKIQALDAQGREDRRRITQLEQTVLITQEEMQELKYASMGYRKIRHRFLDTFSRDSSQGIGPEEWSRIEQGNRAAHSGDLITDVWLYASGQRTNETSLVQLYGLPWRKLEALS
jgi:hypothetical protein